MTIQPARDHKLVALLMAGAALVAGLSAAAPASATSFVETSLVTDSQSFLTSAGFSAAATVDPSLINPWGMDHTSTGAWFIANTGNQGSSSGFATGTFYTGAGVKQSSVAIPQTAVGPMGAGAPTGATGVVYDPSTSQFVVSDLDGHLSTLTFGDTSTHQVATGPAVVGPPHSIYTGVAVGSVNGATEIFAANNATGGIDVYNSNFTPATLASGAFAAPSIATSQHLAAYNVQNIDGNIWVTYAMPGPGSANAPLGLGAVAEFNTAGKLITAFDDPSHMSSPWALALAPSTFGTYAGDLLVGNFSHDDDPNLQDATINAYNPTTGQYLGTIDGSNGQALQLPGLWQIEAGNGAEAGSSGNLYFTAGIGDENHGLFGSISAVPEPSTWAMMLAGVGLIGFALRRRRASETDGLKLQNGAV